MTIEALHNLFLKTSGISTDTRKISKDSLFFALKGSNFNGNTFAKKALESGAMYAVVDEAEACWGEQYILVEDTLKTLQDLARFHRQQFNIPIIGITGSNGKTTSKELIGEVLKQSYNVLMTQGNLNNHLGVPFTLLELKKEHEIAIIEMGANKPGDIKELAEIAEPDYGLITNIGTAHIEGFGSLQGVINTKTELYTFIKNTEGQLFYNSDDDLLSGLLPQNTSSHPYGEKQGEVKGNLKGLTPYVRLVWSYEDYTSPDIDTHLVGKYNFTNFLAAICIGKHFEVPDDAINAALSSYQPSNNRSQVTKTERNTLIVDCYNANPSSMLNALDSFFEMTGDKKVAFLGDMLELGDISVEEHQKVADQLKGKGIEVYFVGNEFQKIESDQKHFLTVDNLIEASVPDQISNGLVLLKGSRGIKLERLIERL